MLAGQIVLNQFSWDVVDSEVDELNAATGMPTGKKVPVKLLGFRSYGDSPAEFVMQFVVNQGDWKKFKDWVAAQPEIAPAQTLKVVGAGALRNLPQHPGANGGLSG